VVLSIIARSGGEENGIASVLTDALSSVSFKSADGDTEVLIDVEDEWESEPYEVPAAIAMEGSLRNWLQMSANYLIL
jgi:hypothetical protein